MARTGIIRIAPRSEIDSLKDKKKNRSAFHAWLSSSGLTGSDRENTRRGIISRGQSRSPPLNYLLLLSQLARLFDGGGLIKIELLLLLLFLDVTNETQRNYRRLIEPINTKKTAVSNANPAQFISFGPDIPNYTPAVVRSLKSLAPEGGTGPQSSDRHC